MTTAEMIAEIKRMDDGEWHRAFAEADEIQHSFTLQLVTRDRSVSVRALQILHDKMCRVIELGRD